MNSRRFANLFAFIAVGFIATALVVKYIATNVLNTTADISYWCDKIAYYLSCLVAIISAFSYATTRRNNAYMIVLVMFIVVIVLFTFFII